MQGIVREKGEILGDDGAVYRFKMTNFVELTYKNRRFIVGAKVEFEPQGTKAIKIKIIQESNDAKNANLKAPYIGSYQSHDLAVNSTNSNLDSTQVFMQILTKADFTHKDISQIRLFITPSVIITIITSVANIINLKLNGYLAVFQFNIFNVLLGLAGLFSLILESMAILKIAKLTQNRALKQAFVKFVIWSVICFAIFYVLFIFENFRLMLFVLIIVVICIFYFYKMSKELTFATDMNLFLIAFYITIAGLLFAPFIIIGWIIHYAAWFSVRELYRYKW